MNRLIKYDGQDDELKDKLDQIVNRVKRQLMLGEPINPVLLTADSKDVLTEYSEETSYSVECDVPTASVNFVLRAIGNTTVEDTQDYLNAHLVQYNGLPKEVLVTLPVILELPRTIRLRVPVIIETVVPSSKETSGDIDARFQREAMTRIENFIITANTIHKNVKVVIINALVADNLRLMHHNEPTVYTYSGYNSLNENIKKLGIGYITIQVVPDMEAQCLTPDTSIEFEGKTDVLLRHSVRVTS